MRGGRFRQDSACRSSWPIAALCSGIIWRRGDEHGFGVLAGGGTTPQARGRGCYRALVHARWLAAQDAGLTALAVQASTQSSPILLRLGFAPVDEMRLLRHQV